MTSLQAKSDIKIVYSIYIKLQVKGIFKIPKYIHRKQTRKQLFGFMNRCLFEKRITLTFSLCIYLCYMYIIHICHYFTNTGTSIHIVQIIHGFLHKPVLEKRLKITCKWFCFYNDTIYFLFFLLFLFDPKRLLYISLYILEEYRKNFLYIRV